MWGNNKQITLKTFPKKPNINKAMLKFIYRAESELLPIGELVNN